MKRNELTAAALPASPSSATEPPQSAGAKLACCGERCASASAKGAASEIRDGGQRAQQVPLGERPELGAGSEVAAQCNVGKVRRQRIRRATKVDDRLDKF